MVRRLPAGARRIRTIGPSQKGSAGRVEHLDKGESFFTGDWGFESVFLQRRVCLASAFHAYRRKDPAFARSVSLDVTRERDVLATSRLALAAFL